MFWMTILKIFEEFLFFIIKNLIQFKLASIFNFSALIIFYGIFSRLLARTIQFLNNENMFFFYFSKYKKCISFLYVIVHVQVQSYSTDMRYLTR